LRKLKRCYTIINTLKKGSGEIPDVICKFCLAATQGVFREGNGSRFHTGLNNKALTAFFQVVRQIAKGMRHFAVSPKRNELNPI